MKNNFVMLVALSLAGCGYTLVGSGDGIPQSVRTIYVAKVDVRQQDLGAGDAIARSLRNEMRKHARFVPVTNASKADAVLEVRLSKDQTRSSGFDEFDEALSYSTVFVAEARLKDGSGRELWSQDRIGLLRNHGAVAGAVVTSSSSFQGEERLDTRDLAVFDGVQVGENRRGAARAKLIAGLAREIYTAMVRGF